ncbi:MAG: hypothetical protein C0513_08440 [Isosphaera sp.]|nr:hypothetical protein [Isosphaera sp.]
MTLVCVPILFDDPESAAREAIEARDAGADLVELRVDRYFSGRGGDEPQGECHQQAERIAQLVARCPLPCIVTCRPVLEGGHYDGPDDARIALMERLGASAGGVAPAHGGAGRAPSYIDVELATFLRSENVRQKVRLAVDHPGQVRAVTTGLILSSHDFHERPPDLLRRLEAMNREPATRVMKIAFRARSLRDNLELLDLLAQSRGAGGAIKPLIALAMGPYGLMSRVLAPKFGAFLTFASLRRDSATAPGQPIIGELLNLYRFGAIGSATRVYGVVGWPVEHSLSPAVHNAGFEAIGHDGVYLPMPVAPGYEPFKATVLELAEHVHLDLSGLSVTIPHKEHLARLAHQQRTGWGDRWSLDRLTELCGAGNTLVIRRDPKGRPKGLAVHNTDGAGLVGVVRGAGVEPAGAEALVLGAGGMARAAAAALALEGARVWVLNRTPERAEALCADIARAAAALPEIGSAIAQRVLPIGRHELAARAPGIVVQCTPLGMAGGPDPGGSPLGAPELAGLPDRALVVETVYRPARTPLLDLARQRGLRTVDGSALFVAQAAEQFRLWTDRAAPSRLFDRVVRESLDADVAGP